MGRILREDSITVAGNGRISGIIVPMALSATVFAFDVDLADSDRQVYEQLSLRLARHPSESDEFLVARLLAYCLEYTEGIEFSRGLSDADDPPIAVCDLTGRLRAWIDVGTPAAERLHRAGKAADRVVVYVHKEHRQWLRQLEGALIHRRDGLVIQAFDPAFVAAFVARLERRMSFALSVAEGDLFVAFADGTITGRLRRVVCPPT
jgi:uncharacterized protein YaeQ